MSIKYLQDQQLNQVQQSPNNSPWAKLIAQSEMLERNRMRQPQGQAPQGTVAGNIQQQLIDAQMKQESETQNADLQKAQMIAQLIGSGHLPANFSAQGYAGGGLTQPQAGTGAYRGIMMPSQGAGANPSYAPQQPVLSYIPPSSQDPAAQEKKHGMMQSMLDNSIVGMAQGKANVGNAMQDYADLFSGKVFGRGFAEGGDIESLLSRNPNLFNVNDVDPRLKALQEQEASNAARLRSMGHRMNVGNIANENIIPSIPQSMMEKLTAAAKQRPLDAIPYKMSEADRLNAMHRASVQPETAPAPSMTEGMSVAAQNPPRIDTMASQMSATDQANSAAKAEAIKAAKSSLIGKGIRSLGLGMGPSAVESMSDIIAPEDWAAKNKALDTGGMHGALGWYAGKVGEGFKQGNERIAQSMSGLGDTIKSNITQPLNEFWNGPNAGAQTNAPPSIPQTDISQFGVDTKAAIPQQPTIGDFSGSATPQAQTKGPAANDKGVIANPNSANKHESTTANTAAINQAHGQGQTQDTSPVTQAVQQAATVAQADQAANKTSDTGMGQGSILDSLYSKLKDTDVDYSDLAKRISENEYDLARERKDGTFNAILGGVGAALSKAGSYEGVGDRVFRPGYGAIAGAGIMGGLKMANESDAAIAKKSQDNTMSMLALKKLKGDSLNNVLDAISAQKQNEVYAQSVANNAVAHRDTAANNAMKTAIDFQQLNINNQVAHKNMEHLDAQIADLYNKASSDPNIQGKVSLAADKARMSKDVLTSLINGMVQPSDPRYIEAMSNFNAAYSDLNSLGGYLKIPTTIVAPNAGSSGANPRGTIVSKTPIQQ